MALADTALDLLDRLIAFPSVSRESNRPIIDFIADWLRRQGAEPVILPDASGEKANLYVHVGPRVDGGVILSGHTDVVPVDGQDWTSDPFRLTRRNGRLYGRGTCDMKGFDALALAAAGAALTRPLKRPLQIALSHDEEVGCLGAPALIERMVADLPRARAAIIGEPSMMKPVSGHKGGIGVATVVRGHEVHSSLQHRGVSAIHEAARLIQWANDRNAENAARTPDPVAARFDPPWTTAHVGTIRGGTAHNITAGECRFTMGFRVVPSESPEDWVAAYTAEVRRVEAAMQAVHPETGIDLSPAFRVPGLRPEQHGAAETLVRRLTGANQSGVVSYGTEAGQFQEGGYSAVICGPGDIAQAHQADEFLSLEQFHAGAAFMERLLDDLCR